MSLSLKSTNLKRPLIVILLCAFLGLSCASSGPVKIVANGDVVKVDYTCSLGNGLIVATTLNAAAKDDSGKLAPIFRPPAHYGPITVEVGATAVKKPAKFGTGKIKAFETIIEQELKKQLPGLPIGQTSQVTLSSEPYDGLLEPERFLSQTRIRTRKKVRQQSLAKYIGTSGSAPEVGLEYESEQAFVAKFVSVDEKSDTITIEIRQKPGTEYTTDFGSAKIFDRGDYYHLVFDVSEGQLVRSGNWIGRISEVEHRRFIVDFGHPFGHEDLQCDVMVEK